jgi:hypothetical protein
VRVASRLAGQRRRRVKRSARLRRTAAY